ncbi:MAG: type II secretion system GspH family protein [Acidobacteriota bacterium]|nr:type II secretion system GspH family protein [Acidobacteriota bacterium]
MCGRCQLKTEEHPPDAASGFTLLELLVVIAIMSATAWMALSVVGDDAGQIRYEDTRNRLAAIREAVLGEDAAEKRGILAGFVADNGRLPESISELTSTPVGWDSFGADVAKKPIFDPTPDSEGYNNNDGDDVLLGAPRQQLMKGHRGTYLRGRNAAGEYRDGWGIKITGGASGKNCPAGPAGKGNDDDTKNYGWCVTQDDDGTELYVDSYGMNGTKNPDPPEENLYEYEDDVSMSEPVLKSDWTTDIAGYSVKVDNRSSGDIVGELRVALLVYDNKPSATHGKWRQWISDSVSGCPDGDEIDIEFPDDEIPIPIGEHLLVLVRDDAPYQLPSGEYVTARVQFFPRYGVSKEKMKLVIR